MIELKNISVTFQQKKQEIQAVQDVSLTIDKGDIYGIVGYSGAGKSTLVRVINLLQRPTAGTVIINKENILTFSKKELRQQRKKIGMFFQHFNLMKERTIFSNIDFSLKYSGLSKSERRQKISHLLELVGLSEKRDAYPSQLSGGQKQRVAIARALIHERSILLVDEGTSALDAQNADLVEKSLLANPNLTLILISHHLSDKRKAQFDCVYELMPTSSRA